MHGKQLLHYPFENLPYSAKFWQGKTSENLANGIVFANILPCQIHPSYFFEMLKYPDITFCACVSNSRISQDVHLELFSSCEAEARFTRSFRPLSELIPLTAIASANVKVLAALEDGEELNK